MKSFAPVALSTVLLAASAFGQQFMLNTPEGVVQCQPILLSWTTGGTPPYILSVLPANQPSAQPLEQYTGLQGTTFTWNANIQGGTQVGLTLRDSTGAQSSTAPFPINSGGDSSCLSLSSGGPVSTSGGAGSAPGSTPGSTPASTPASTPGSTPASTPASTPVTTPVSTPGSSTTSKPASSGGSSSVPAPSSSGSPSGASGAIANAVSVGAAALAAGFAAVVLA